MRSGGTAQSCAAAAAAAVTHSSHKMAERVPIFLWRIACDRWRVCVHRSLAKQSARARGVLSDLRGDLDVLMSVPPRRSSVWSLGALVLRRRFPQLRDFC